MARNTRADARAYVENAAAISEAVMQGLFEPVKFMNVPGDRVKIVGLPVEGVQHPWLCVTADYDKSRNLTRVGLFPLIVDHLLEQMAKTQKGEETP